MDLKKLMSIQLEMDRLHGFPVDFDNDRAKYLQLTKDLVGLFGEVGEFSNIVKKINIHLDHPEVYEYDLGAAEHGLAEELVDAFIYIIRIAAILRLDLEQGSLDKMILNRARYSGLRYE